MLEYYTISDVNISYNKLDYEEIIQNIYVLEYLELDYVETCQLKYT